MNNPDNVAWPDIVQRPFDFPPESYLRRESDPPVEQPRDDRPGVLWIVGQDMTPVPGFAFDGGNCGQNASHPRTARD